MSKSKSFEKVKEMQERLPYLSKIECEKVMQFCDDPTMKEAIHKLYLAGVYYNGTLEPDSPANAKRNFLLSYAIGNQGQDNVDEKIVGQNVKAAAEGVRLVEMAKQEIDAFERPPESDDDETNPGA